MWDLHSGMCVCVWGVWVCSCVWGGWGVGVCDGVCVLGVCVITWRKMVEFVVIFTHLNIEYNRIYILWCQSPKHSSIGLYLQISHKSAQLH